MPDILGQGMSQEETERMMDEMFPTREEIPMYVLSNETKVNGAIWMTNPEALNEISEKMGGDYYIWSDSEYVKLPEDAFDGFLGDDEFTLKYSTSVSNRNYLTQSQNDDSAAVNTTETSYNLSFKKVSAK